jgi:integrase
MIFHFLVVFTAKPEPKPRISNKLKLIDVPPFPALVDSIKRALNHVDEGKYKLRDLALISILVFTGCRISEALSLTKSDVDRRGKVVKIRQLKKKSEFVRIVPVPNELFWNIISRYVERITSDKLFTITYRQAYNVVIKFSLRYLKMRVRPHAFRHAYALQVLKTTKDLEIVRRLLGHSDYKHLKYYLDYTQEDLADELSKALNV